MSKNIIVSINGLDIREDSVYKVVGKVDPSAPSGYVELGVSKVPQAGIGNRLSVRWVKTGVNADEGLFDTGLYANSPVFSTKSKEETTEILKAVKKYIIDPYETKYGEKGKLSQSNTSFWKNYGVNVYDGKFFSTESVDDLLGLYIAMIGYGLTPKSELGNPAFSNSDYGIEDKERVKSIREERADDSITAIAEFGIMLDKNKPMLLNVLKYVGVPGLTQNTDDSTLKAVFFEWISKSSNAKTFRRVIDLTKDKKTQDVVSLYAILEEALRQKTVTRQGNNLVYKEHILGADLKGAANNLNVNKDLEEVKEELITLSLGNKKK